ncbi:hypothetical protein [Falsiroseomonas sp.]|uniref:hypothetical protein n=1 Tax=Falsiroseomonas sp. TaxID=2870721 RepID=UPI0027350A6E|nr:hypothetical protein [Falsiroseomonas sp.]MDP3417851.1 hypothetical protein [Falsiroseomonas sp.]
MDHVTRINTAAAALADAIFGARAAGYRVQFPDHTLRAIPISETGRVAQPAPASVQPDVALIGKAKPAETKAG